LLVLVEEGLRGDGLLEKGFDWYVQTVKLDPSPLHTLVFNGVLASWKEKLGSSVKPQARAASQTRDPWTVEWPRGVSRQRGYSERRHLPNEWYPRNDFSEQLVVTSKEYSRPEPSTEGLLRLTVCN
jgi:hypothetical protein